MLTAGVDAVTDANKLLISDSTLLVVDSLEAIRRIVLRIKLLLADGSAGNSLSEKQGDKQGL